MPEETLPNCRFSNGDMGIMMRKCDPNKKSCPGDPNLNDIYCVGRSSKELVSKRLNINKDPTPGSGIAGRRQFFNDIYAYDLNDENGALIEPPVGCDLLGCDSVESGDFTGRPSQLIVRSEGYKLSNNEDLATNQPAYQINQSSASSSTTSPVKTVLDPSYEEAAKDNGLPGQLGKSSANGRSTVVTFQMNASGGTKFDNVKAEDNESGFNGNKMFKNSSANMYSITNGAGPGGATDFCSELQESPCVRIAQSNTDPPEPRTPIFAPGDAIPISNFDVVYDINGDGDRSWFLVNGKNVQLSTGTRATSKSGRNSNEGATFCNVGDPLSSPSPLVAGDNAFTCAQKLCHMSGNKFCDPTEQIGSASSDVVCRKNVTGMPPTLWDGDPSESSTAGYGCAGNNLWVPTASPGNNGFYTRCKSSRGAIGGYVPDGDQLNNVVVCPSGQACDKQKGAFIAKQGDWGCDCVGQKRWCGCVPNAMGETNVDIYSDVNNPSSKTSSKLPSSNFFYTGQWNNVGGFTSFGCTPYVYQSVFAANPGPGMKFDKVTHLGAGRMCTNHIEEPGAGCEATHINSTGVCNMGCPP
jgi:hypothetical protein